MKNSRPLPVKRTIGSHKGGSNSQQQSSCHSSKGSQRPPPQQQQQQQHPKEGGKTHSKSNNNHISEGKGSQVSNVDKICDICAQNVPGPERAEIFAFGKCDHHVCYVCSARLRAVCDQQECPICREKLETVIFSSYKNKPYDKHDIASFSFDKRYGIYFEDATAQDAFNKLLKFECLKCLEDDRATKEGPEPDRGYQNDFPNVTKLKQHLNFTHKLRLCDLCLTHNKLFPFEYSYYDIVSLRKHQKDGEPNTSHRGHPDCTLCHNTFFNQDELIQHMSREHYHCHLCGRHNTTMHIYFLDYASLRNHFKAEHFLCERGNCRHEQFTSAFDSELDYQLHIVNVHGGSANASRGEARQQRTITLDSAPHRPPTNRQQQNVPRNAAVVSTGTLATANASDPMRLIPESIQLQMRQQRLPTRSDFPTLGNMGSSFNEAPTSQSVIVPSTSSASQFPTLPQNNPSQQSRVVTTSYRVTAGPSSSRGAFNRSAGGGVGRPDQLDQMDFPPLPEQPKSKASKSKAKQSKPARRDEAPTLEQLINNSLTVSSRSNGKSKPNKVNKSAKQRPLKFQL